MNLKLVTLSNLIKFKELLMGIINNKINELKQLLLETINTKVSELNDAINTKVNELNNSINTGLATKSDTNHTHEDATIVKSGFMSSSDKVKLNGLINYTAGQYIKIENGVISVQNDILSTRTVTTFNVPGYTLYGDYYIANTPFYNVCTLDEANQVKQPVTIYKTIDTYTTYAITGEVKSTKTTTETVTAETLPLKAFVTINNLYDSPLNIYDNPSGTYAIWTSDGYGVTEIRFVGDNPFIDTDVSVYRDNIGARLGFKNPYSTYPTCPGYTLYGDYFLADELIINKTWEEACNITRTVTVSKPDGSSRNATARSLTKIEFDSIVKYQRVFYNNQHNDYYWTATKYYEDDSIDNTQAYVVDPNFGRGGLETKYITESGLSSCNWYSDPATYNVRLGFRNPFA